MLQMVSDKPSGSWWACNTTDKSHQNERDLETMQVRDCTFEDNLKELIGTTYINKMHLLFSSPSHKNFTVKRAWLGIVMRWVTF